MEILEFDQDMNLVKGREAISLKIMYIVHILRGEIPYSSIGLPVKFFSFDSPDLKAYIDSKFQENGIQAKTTLSSSGRLTVYDTDILFEGDL